MPKVDPSTHEPMSDDPDQADQSLAGGQREVDPKEGGGSVAPGEKTAIGDPAYGSG